MNYELAKKLKEAGFPVKYPDNLFVEGEKSAYIPTLSELIKACVTNKEERCIYRLDYDWFERQWEASAGAPDEHFAGFGKTPEEAVAKLWLGLNKEHQER